jgi:hypothetical protein
MPFQEIVESTTIVNEIISPGLFQTTTTSFLCKPLFKVISSVVINKAFSIKASGLLETLFDAVTKTWYPSKISFLHDKNETKGSAELVFKSVLPFLLLFLKKNLFNFCFPKWQVPS